MYMCVIIFQNIKKKFLHPANSILFLGKLIVLAVRW